MDLCAPPPLLLPLLLLLCACGVQADDEILPGGPLKSLAGDTATFRTLMKNPEFIVITWTFNDGVELHQIATLVTNNLNVDDKYTDRANIDSNGTLTLSAVTPEDSGAYIISITDKLGNTRPGEIDLHVFVPVSDVKIEANVPEARELNTKVVLTCSAKGNFLKFQWLNVTTPITAEGSRVTVEHGETSSTLSFSSVYRTDLVGPLYCAASNDLTAAKSPAFNLSVHYGPELVTISPASPPEYVASKSDFSLTCSASSSPAATFTWFRNDVKLETTGPSLKLKDIEDKGGQDRASYTCNATNAKTDKTVASEPVTFAVIEKVEGVKVTGPTGKLFAGNGSATLTCEATKGSMQKVEWTKDGAALKVGGRVSVVNSSVTIKPLQKEDNGVFTCQISNPVSKDTAQVKLIVFYGPEPVQLTGDSEVEVTDDVRLECSAASMPPANYTWKLNGTKLSFTGKVYTIAQAKYSETGTYTCEAFNEVTGKTATKEHFLSVKEEGALDEGLSDGAIAGIVIGVLAAVAIAIGVFLYCRQKVPVESPY